MSDGAIIALGMFQLAFGLFCGYIAWGRRYFAAKSRAWDQGWYAALECIDEEPASPIPDQGEVTL